MSGVQDEDEIKMENLISHGSVSNHASQQQNQIQPAPREPHRRWPNATGTAVAALIAAVVFGRGAWVGMNYGNSYLKKSYEWAPFGICHNYEVRNLGSHIPMAYELAVFAKAARDSFICCQLVASVFSAAERSYIAALCR